MTVGSVPMRGISANARIPGLIREFQNGDEDHVLVPMTQAALADQWGISSGSVQDFLRRHEQTGAVISRSPLIIDARRSSPDLRLVTSIDAAPDMDHTSAPSNTCSSRTAHATTTILERCLDLMIDAALQGNVTMANSLKTAALCCTNPMPFDRPPLLDDHHQTRVYEGPAAAQNRVYEQESELEVEKKLFSSSSLNTFLSAGLAAAEAAELPPHIVTVMTKRLADKALSPSAECTPAWERANWASRVAWSDDDLASINRYWTQAGISTHFSSDARAAVQLWRPEVAAKAIRSLAARSDTRNPAARILDAAIWGYHSFFPLEAHSQPTDETTSIRRLTKLADHLKAFDLQTLMQHIQSFSDVPQDLNERAALALHLKLVTPDQLEQLPVSLPEIEKHAAMVSAILTGGTQ